jgi:alpha-1,2-mannosyltransferase
VAALQVAGAVLRPAGERFVDLDVYAGAVRLLLDGGSLYDFVGHNDAPFTYPPFAGLLFVPAALLPTGVLEVAWTGATLAVVVLIAWLGRRAAGLPAWAWPAVALLLFASAPVSSNLRFGQVSVFLVALVLVDGLGVVPPRYRGVATGVAAALKLTPAIFIPWFWFSGQRRTAVTATATFLVAAGLAWLVLPGESARFWFTELRNVDRVGNIATGGNQSLNGALLRWDAPDTVRVAIVGTLGLAVVVAALVRAVHAFRRADPLAAVVIVGAAALVFSPVSWTHHQVWLVLAALLPVATRWAAPGARRAVRIGWPALVVVVMVLPVTSVGSDVLGAAVAGNGRLWLAVAVAAVVPFAAGTPAAKRLPESDA